eukprot:812665-Pelagomonas_calceolata.AAC.8
MERMLYILPSFGCLYVSSLLHALNFAYARAPCVPAVLTETVVASDMHHMDSAACKVVCIRTQTGVHDSHPQVYASYTLERALAEGAKLRDLQALEASRGVSEEEAKKGMATAGFGQGQAFDSPQHSRDHGQEAQKGLGPRFVGKVGAPLVAPDACLQVYKQYPQAGL